MIFNQIYLRIIIKILQQNEEKKSKAKIEFFQNINNKF